MLPMPTAEPMVARMNPVRPVQLSRLAVILFELPTRLSKPLSQSMPRQTVPVQPPSRATSRDRPNVAQADNKEDPPAIRRARKRKQSRQRAGLHVLTDRRMRPA